MQKLPQKLLASSAIALSLFGAASFASIQPASAQTAPPAVTQGIDSAIATVQALDGLAIAALAVALVPLGSMLTLRFLNMVLSRV